MKNRIDNVLVTGGSGFVGHWLEVCQPPGIEAVYVGRKLYQTRWEIGRWDAIVHLAPVSPTRVLKYAEKRGAKVLYASSGAVYQGANDYAAHKREWEAICNASEADVVTARLFTFIGAGLKDHYAITHFIEAAKAGKPLSVWGDGSCVRSYLYGEDLGSWLWRILLDGNGVYDVGSAVPYTILQVARMVADATGAKIELMPGKVIETPVYLPDVERAVNLGCRETVGLEEAIRKTIDDS